jgi:cytochrome c6
MKLSVMCVTAAFFSFILIVPAAYAKGKSGEELFKENCSMCHPNGGNIINPGFTLHKKDREAHGVVKAEDIIGKMRNPGPGMTRFDKKTIPDKDARKIAEYILKIFK